MNRPSSTGISRLASVADLALLLVVAGQVCLSPLPANAALLRTVALTGDPAPGAENGAVLTTFFAPILNAAGDVAFGARSVELEDLGVRGGPHRDGLWAGQAGALKLVALEDAPAAGTLPGVVYSDFHNPPRFNDRGDVAFLGSIRGTGVDGMNKQGIWLTQETGELGLVVRESDPTPPGARLGPFTGFSNPVLNASGDLAFRTLNGVDALSNQAIWSYTSGSLTPVAESGDPVPGTQGATFTTVLGPSINSQGEVVFIGNLTGDGRPSRALWSTVSGELSIVMRVGDRVPQAGPDMVVRDVTGGTLQESGVINLRALLRDESNDTVSLDSLWRWRPEGLELVASAQQPAPGAAEGVTFGRLSSVSNTQGEVAILGSLVGEGLEPTYDQGIWTEVGASLHLQAREGDLAPGAGGARFAHLELPSFNDRGQVLFQAALTGDKIDETNDKGIWALDRSGELSAIIREGEAIEVAAGDVRNIRSFYRGTFNNTGEFSFQASFTDGTQGVFVSRIATLPEPPAVALLALGLAALPLRRVPLLAHHG